MRLSTLPRSLRAVRSSVRNSGTGAAVLNMGRRASRVASQQGTRAFPGQGTMASGNTPNPLNPGQTVTPHEPQEWDQVGLTPTMTNFSPDIVEQGATGVQIQTRDWPPNPSDHIYSAAAGRSEQLRTDASVQLGGAPGRIPRDLPARIWGVVGPSTGLRGTEDGYYAIADKDYLPHVPVPRQALGVKGSPVTTDDNAVIPTVYAGNPRA